MTQDKRSRYAKTPLTVVKHPSGESQELRDLREIPPTPAVFSLTAVEGDRLDLLADRYYRDPLRFWKICDASDHLDPFDIIAVNQPVAIPPNK